MKELQIPDEAYEKLKAYADRRGQSIEDAVSDIITRVYPPREEEMRRLRAALGDDLEDPDADMPSHELRPHEAPIDHAALRASMPVLDPPLSAAVISEREDRV